MHCHIISVTFNTHMHHAMISRALKKQEFYTWLNYTARTVLPYAHWV